MLLVEVVEVRFVPRQDAGDNFQLAPGVVHVSVARVVQSRRRNHPGLDPTSQCQLGSAERLRRLADRVAERDDDAIGVE